MVTAFLDDVRDAARSVRRAASFSLVAILTLTLSLVASTTLLSVLNALVLRTLPVDSPRELAVISLADPRTGQMRFVYLSTFEAFQRRQKSFETVTPYSGGGTFRIDVRGERVDAGVESGTPDYFAMLRVRPYLGRLIAADDAPSCTQAQPVAMISYRLWQQQLGADVRAIGERINVDGVPVTIIGVMPAAFHGLQVDQGADVMVPLALLRQFAGDLRRPHRARNAIGRLRSGVTVEQARAEVTTLWPALQDSTMPAGLSALDRAELRSARVNLDSIAAGFSNMRTRYGSQLETLVAFAVVLVVIGCVNLSGLMLTRTIARGHQLAIRVALGASRSRLVQRQLVESLLLSLTGTALAMPLVWWTSRQLARTLWASTLPLAMSMTPDARVFGIAAAMALATGVLVAVLPAWEVTREPVNGGALVGRPVVRWTGRSSKVLVVAQVALSLLLLASAGLFARSLTNLRANAGWGTPRRIVFTRLWTNPDDHRSHDDAAYYPALTRALSQLPGAESVGLSMYFPSYLNIPLAPDTVTRADAPPESAEVEAVMEMTSPRFFETVGITRLQGRDFTWDDHARGAPVAMVNATVARLLFPSVNAIGQRIRIGKDPSRQSIEVVGVVADAALGNVRQPHGALVFRPILQEPQRAMVPVVHVRTIGDPRAYGDALARMVGTFGRHFVRRRMVITLDEQIDQALLQERLLATVASCFAALAALLACIGVYGLLSFTVVRRAREIGVRIALGATRPSVLRMVVRDALVLAGAGVAIGIPCTVAMGRFSRALLYNLTPVDPATLMAAGGGFLVLAAAAALLPALRASAIEPIQALRHD